jgi:mitogen-activated protein kinase kinase 1
MSPERFQADKFSFPSDIWSLGLVVLECYLGSFPIVGSKNGYALATYTVLVSSNRFDFKSHVLQVLGYHE